MTGPAVIGGSGLAGLPGECLGELPVQTPWGEASCAPRRYRVAGREVLFLARHGMPHGIAPHRVNYRANLWVLREAGVTDVVAVNAVGGIAAALRPGDFVVPDDLIDYTWGRAHTYCDGPDPLPLRHVDFTRPFDAELSAALLEAWRAAGGTVHAGGVYGVAQGPRLESAAEIRRMARDGCDLVGMTAMPEAALARELGLRYAMVCLVTNPAAGLGGGTLDGDVIARQAAAGMAVAARALTGWLQRRG